MIGYLCKSLRIVSLVWPTRLIFLAMGEVLSDGFNTVVLNPSDRKGHETYLYCLGFLSLHHIILLKALLCSL